MINSNEQDAARWREFMKGKAIYFEGLTEKGRPWSVYYAPRDNHKWQESFTAANEASKCSFAILFRARSSKYLER